MSLHIKADSVADELRRLRFSLEGSTGNHVIIRDIDGSWNCSCIGFTTHQKCKHVTLGKKIFGTIADIWYGNNARQYGLLEELVGKYVALLGVQEPDMRRNLEDLWWDDKSTPYIYDRLAKVLDHVGAEERLEEIVKGDMK